MGAGCGISGAPHSDPLTFCAGFSSRHASRTATNTQGSSLRSRSKRALQGVGPAAWTTGASPISACMVTVHVACPQNHPRPRRTPFQARPPSASGGCRASSPLKFCMAAAKQAKYAGGSVVKAPADPTPAAAAARHFPPPWQACYSWCPHRLGPSDRPIAISSATCAQQMVAPKPFMVGSAEHSSLPGCSRRTGASRAHTCHSAHHAAGGPPGCGCTLLMLQAPQHGCWAWHRSQVSGPVESSSGSGGQTAPERHGS